MSELRYVTAEEIAPTLKESTPEEWESYIRCRQLHTKQDYWLIWLADFYERKLELLQSGDPAFLPMTERELAIHISKVGRIKNKYACTLKEMEFRADLRVDREAEGVLHNTDYFIDLDSGDNGAAGTSTGTAWLTIEQYTTTTSRSPGDRAFVRAGTSETVGALNIEFDEDGTAASNIWIIGCDSVVNDPWSDSSDVLPLIDFNSGAYGMYLYGDDYWHFTRLEIANSTSVSGTLETRGSLGVTHENLYVHGSSYGLYPYYAGFCEYRDIAVDDCDFGIRLASANTNIIFERVDIDDCSDSGIYHYGGVSDILFKDCKFGETTNSPRTLQSRSHGVIHFINCLFSDTLDIYYYGVDYYNAIYFSEDHNQVLGATLATSQSGRVSRDTTIQIDSLPSIKMEPSAECELWRPITSNLYVCASEYSHAVKLGAGTHTITIYARETAAWTTDPTSSEFFLRASYIPGSSGATRSYVDSDESLNGINLVGFQVQVTLQQESWVYLQFILNKYESGKSVNMSTVVGVS